MTAATHGDSMRIEMERLDPTNVSLVDFGTRQYVAWINIGTPPQRFQVLVDTGSADLWIRSSKVRKVGRGQGYDHAASTTFHSLHQRWSILYGTGSASGTVIQDNVALEGLPGVSQVLAEATSLDRTFMSLGAHFDGILGLAFRDIAQDHGMNLIESMYEKGLLSHAMVTFHLHRGIEKRGSYLTLGKPKVEPGQILVDAQVLGSTGMWFTTLSRVEASNGETMCTSNTGIPCIALLDSGTSFIIVSTSLQADFERLLYKDRPDCAHLRCSQGTWDGIPHLAFKLGGAYFTLPPEAFVERRHSVISGESFLEMQIQFVHDDLHRIILGDKFMRYHDTTFDLNGYRMLIARSDSCFGAAGQTVTFAALPLDTMMATLSPIPCYGSMIRYDYECRNGSSDGNVVIQGKMRQAYRAFTTGPQREIGIELVQGQYHVFNQCKMLVANGTYGGTMVSCLVSIHCIDPSQNPFSILHIAVITAVLCAIALLCCLLYHRKPCFAPTNHDEKAYLPLATERVSHKGC